MRSSPGSEKRSPARIASSCWSSSDRVNERSTHWRGSSGVSIANVSQHLQALRQAALVESRKQGLFVYYRIADPAIFDLCRALRTVAERRLADLDRVVRITSAIGPARSWSRCGNCSSGPERPMW